MKQLYLASLGCTKNLVDSEVMLGKLKDYTITDTPQDADLIIINSCGFIESAKQESLETIFELDSLRKKGSVLVVSGCLSQRYKDELPKELAEVDIFTGVGDYDKIDQLVEQKRSQFSDKVYLADGIEDRVVTGSNYHAYIKLSEGCNQQCSFCSIPSFKGKLQSRTLESVVNEVKRLVAKGYYDFSFVSQDSSSYGRDLGKNEYLIDLINAVENIHGVKTAKVLYLYPSTLTKAMIDAIAESKVFENYFDIPIQHIDDTMLKKMKRGLGEDKTKQLLYYMKQKPNAFMRTGVIVGHPFETDESFSKLKNFLQSFDFDRVSVFEYSDEEQTPAYSMDNKVDGKSIKRYSKALESICKPNYDKLVGQVFEAVIEGYSSEHEFLLKAKPLQWAFEIDGEVLVNDTQDANITFGQIYTLEVTEIVGEYPIAKVLCS
jgi:ribosomal protein S12 methylthiotransferase RimO